jgi:hypothetical protein
VEERFGARGKFVLTDNVIENDFEGPGSSDGSNHLEEHGDEDYDERAAIGFEKAPDQGKHVKNSLRLTCGDGG